MDQRAGKPEECDGQEERTKEDCRGPAGHPRPRPGSPLTLPQRPNGCSWCRERLTECQPGFSSRRRYHLGAGVVAKDQKILRAVADLPAAAQLDGGIASSSATASSPMATLGA